MPIAFDLSEPLATLLRESTKEAHKTVENSEGARLLLSGHLPRDDYIRYLMMLWHVYDTFERALDRHSTHPTLESTYNPTLLARAPALAADISYLLEVEESSWKHHPTHVSLIASAPPALGAYVSRIQELADAADPSPLLAHAYVRYLGDLSGGQTIRHTIAKAYNLDETSGQGISFYAFKELQSAKPAKQGEMKRIKDWFRDGMNAGGNRSMDVKASIVNEANTAFDLNSGLFASIGVEETEPETSKEIPIEIEQVQQEKEYPLSQVAAVIAAVCLAHFILVVGGFTGDKGYQKLQVVEQWLTNAWQSHTD